MELEIERKIKMIENWRHRFENDVFCSNFPIKYIRCSDIGCGSFPWLCSSLFDSIRSVDQIHDDKIIIQRIYIAGNIYVFGKTFEAFIDFIYFITL